MMSFLRKSRGLFALTKFSDTLPASRNYCSALFISGNKASETFSYLSPYLDFDRRFEDLEKLKRELRLRRTEIDAIEIKEMWDFYKNIFANKWALEQRRNEIVNKIDNLMQKKELAQEEETELVALKAQSKVFKHDIKVIKEVIWDLDTVVVRALKLPNEIDARTPDESSVVLKTFGEPVNFSPEVRKSHLDIGRALGIIEYTNPLQYYLCNEAALFELGIFNFCGEILGQDATRIAGSDFIRSLVVEGSGLNHEDPMESFILTKDADSGKNSSSRLHLVGGASLISILSLYTKQIINTSKFPLKYFATGKQYFPVPQNSPLTGLFNVCQSSIVQAFSFVQEAASEEYKVEFDNLMQKAIDIYDQLGIHYRIVMRPASELRAWESLKASFEVWSPFSQQYIEVGFISAYGDFISKRLLIAYLHADNTNFPAIISGILVSVPRLLACVLEQNPHELKIPNIIQLHMHKKVLTE